MLPHLFAITLVALQRFVVAQVSCNTTVKNLYLNDTADDAAASQCQQLNLDLWIAENRTGAVSLDGLQIAGFNNSGGGLHAINVAGLTSLSSNSLELAGGWIQMQNLSSITRLSFPNLSHVGLALNLRDMPALTELELPGGLVAGYFRRTAGSFSGAVINTGLSKVERLFSDSPSDITITGNPNLTAVTLWPTEILLQFGTTSDTGNLEISDNGMSVSVNLPNLFSTAGSITLADTSELLIPSLALVEGSLTITDAQFSSLSAPELQRIKGDLKITGNYSELKFPALTKITGNVILQSANFPDCDHFRQLATTGSIQGVLSCTGSSSNSTASSAASSHSPVTSSTVTSASRDRDGGGLSSGAMAGIAVAAAVGGLTLIGALCFILVRHRRKRASEAAAESAKSSTFLEAQEVPHELPPNLIHEIAGDHRYSTAELETSGTPSN